MFRFPTRTASFPNKRQAERWAKTVEAEMIEGRHFRSAEARRRTVTAAVDRFVEEELPKKKDARNPKIRLLWWKERIGKLRLADVSAAVLVEQRGKFMRDTFARAKPQSKRSTIKDGQARHFKRSGKTWNRYAAALSKLFTVARKEWHWASHNPFDGVSKYAEGKGRVRVFVGGEQRLFAQTSKDHQLHTITNVALSTAPRAGELTRLHWSDLELEHLADPKATSVRAYLRETKNSEARTAWLIGEALRLMREHWELAGRPSSGRVFTSKTGRLYRYHTPFVEALEAAKIQDFRFHDLRHCSATWLAREGATEQPLKAIGGWKSNVVSKYVHLAAEDARTIVEKMNDKLLLGTEKN